MSTWEVRARRSLRCLIRHEVMRSRLDGRPIMIRRQVRAHVAFYMAVT